MTAAVAHEVARPAPAETSAIAQTWAMSKRAILALARGLATWHRNHRVVHDHGCLAFAMVVTVMVLSHTVVPRPETWSHIRGATLSMTHLMLVSHLYSIRNKRTAVGRST